MTRNFIGWRKPFVVFIIPFFLLLVLFSYFIFISNNFNTIKEKSLENEMNWMELNKVIHARYSFETNIPSSDEDFENKIGRFESSFNEFRNTAKGIYISSEITQRIDNSYEIWLLSKQKIMENDALYGQLRNTSLGKKLLTASYPDIIQKPIVSSDIWMLYRLIDSLTDLDSSGQVFSNNLKDITAGINQDTARIIGILTIFGTILAVFIIFSAFLYSRNSEEKILRFNRLYEFVSNVNQSIVKIKDSQTLFNELCRVAVEIGGFSRVWIGLIDKEKKIIKLVAQCGFEENSLKGIKLSEDFKSEREDPASVALNTGKYNICNNVFSDSRMKSWLEDARKKDYSSLAAFPIFEDNEMIGIISFYSSKINFFIEGELNPLQELAGDLSFALSKLKSEKELEDHRHKLEKLVKEKTLELNEKIESLEKFTKLAVGRELKMRELKNKLEKIEKESKNK